MLIRWMKTSGRERFFPVGASFHIPQLSSTPFKINKPKPMIPLERSIEMVRFTQLTYYLAALSDCEMAALIELRLALRNCLNCL